MPYYLSIGMPYELFWQEDPWLARKYHRASELRRQRTSEEMWLQGLYNFNAFSTALSNLNFGKRRRKPNHYMEEPVRVIPLTEEEKEQKAKRERERLIHYFNRLEKQWNENAP